MARKTFWLYPRKARRENLQRVSPLPRVHAAQFQVLTLCQLRESGQLEEKKKFQHKKLIWISSSDPLGSAHHPIVNVKFAQWSLNRTDSWLHCKDHQGGVWPHPLVMSVLVLRGLSLIIFCPVHNNFELDRNASQSLFIINWPGDGHLTLLAGGSSIILASLSSLMRW